MTMSPSISNRQLEIRIFDWIISPRDGRLRSMLGRYCHRVKKESLVRRLLPFQNRVVNPIVVGLINIGLGPPTYAILETTGRRTGQIRHTPVANGLQGDIFWLIAGRGEQASFVKNIRTNPNVRVKARPARIRDGFRMRWRSGTACPLPHDDASQRHHQLGRGRPGYRVDGIFLRALDVGEMLTVRIDLD
jgi:deazaflavin-dependent oxidoreductase (nitroreductase family)